jgi:hypothetical protein
MAANPNTLGGIPEAWSKEYQINHLKVPVFSAIANYRLASGLKVGDTVHRSFASSIVAKVMGADGSYSTQALVDTDESLVIDKNYEASFFIKSLDELQNSLPVRSKYAQLSSRALFNQMDGDILGLYAQFTSSLDAAAVGGTSGEGITVTPANAKKIFFAAKKKLQKQNVMLDNGAGFSGSKSEDDSNAMGVAVISPDFYQALLEAVDGKDTIFGDKVAQSGHAGSFGGFQLFVTNALAWTATLELPTIPTAGDTIVINGVTFTAAADGAATNAGDFSIQATVDLAAASLVQAINGTGTAGADNYIELSAANRLLMRNITATYDSATNLLTLVATGWGSVAVSETLTPAGDVWTPAKQIQHCLFGAANAIDVVIQKEPSVEAVPVTGKVGKDVVTWAAAGFKVFEEGKAMMVDVKVRTDAY